MIDERFIKLIERIGYINKNGEHIYGTAALLHYLHCPVSQINPQYIKRGKAYVEKLLSA